MEVVVAELGRDSVAGIHPTVGVLTALDHEVLDDAVEGRSVIPAFVHQLDEIVAVQRCVVVQLGFDGALRGLDDHDGFFLLRLAAQSGENECHKDKLFHIFYSYSLRMEYLISHFILFSWSESGPAMIQRWALKEAPVMLRYSP